MKTHNSNDLNEKLRRAKEWLGERYVLHPAYQPKPYHGSTYEMLRPKEERRIPE